MPVRVLALPRYGELGASSRMRSYQYFPILKQAGFQVEVQPLFDDASLSARYLTGRYGFQATLDCYARRVMCLTRAKRFDVIWIEKEAIPWWPRWFELSFLQGTPYVLDFDDAVFHNYDQHRLGLVRRLYGQRLDGLMARAALVVVGNDYLANRAICADAPWVEVLPTVVDLGRYPVTRPIKQAASSLPRIVWIGSPSTAYYLDVLREPLQSLSFRVPFVLRVIGAEVDLPGVNVECVKWTEATEVASIAECTLGVMPLLNSAWESGKCGYKLIQYMACRLPVIASPIGVNTQIVEDGSNGFLATTAKEWVDALERLLTNTELCIRMGREGRRRVESKYCLQVTGSRMVELLKQSVVRSV